MERAFPAPLLIATLGVPGSGKTHFSRRLCREANLFHLNSDRMRSELSLSPTKIAEETAAVFRIMDFVADEVLLRGGGVVYDALFSRREYRKRVEAIAARRGARYMLLWFQTPYELAAERAESRVGTESEERAYYPLANRIDVSKAAATIEEPHDEPFVVDGRASYDEQLESLLTAF
jgi:predicted kinase